MRRVIVGYDGDDEAGDALALARLLAEPLDAELIVAFASTTRGGLESADEVLSAAAAALSGTRHEARAVRGRSAAAALADLAAEASADLVVIGSTDRGPLGRVYPGTTATRLIAATSCPVAVAPRGYADDHPTRIRTIAVGYREDYPDSHPALAEAERLAGFFGALVRVRSVKGVGGPEAARALALAGEKADLLVLGSRHFPPPVAAVVASVSSRIAASPPCPLLVVPESGGGDG